MSNFKPMAMSAFGNSRAEHAANIAMASQAWGTYGETHEKVFAENGLDKYVLVNGDGAIIARNSKSSELVKNDNVTTLGSARASEIVVNVLLPAVFAMATRSQTDNTKFTGLKNRALELYSQHPKLAENSLVKLLEICSSPV